MEVWFIYVRLSCSSWSSYREKRKLPKYIRQKFLAGFVLNICCRLFSQNQLLWFEILLLERKVLVRTHSFSTFLSLFEFIFRRLELLTSDSSFFMNNGQVQWGVTTGSGSGHLSCLLMTKIRRDANCFQARHCWTLEEGRSLGVKVKCEMLSHLVLWRKSAYSA